MDLLQDARYKDTPVYIFFENYILDCIGKLPEEKNQLLHELDLQGVFATQSTNWKDVVRDVLKLSSTIDLAILNAWYLSVENSAKNQSALDPAQFSKDFVDEYFSENSIIDIWDEKSLLEAKSLVQKHQMQEKSTV